MNKVLILLVAGVLYCPRLRLTPTRSVSEVARALPRLRFGLVLILLVAGVIVSAAGAAAEPPTTKPASKSSPEFLEIRCRGADLFDDIAFFRAIDSFHITHPQVVIHYGGANDPSLKVAADLAAGRLEVAFLVGPVYGPIGGEGRPGNVRRDLLMELLKKSPCDYFVAGRSAMAVAVHPLHPLREIDQTEAEQILACRPDLDPNQANFPKLITSGKFFGPPGRPIHVLTDCRASPIMRQCADAGFGRLAPTQIAKGIKELARDRWAMGFMYLDDGLAASGLKILPVRPIGGKEAVLPSPENVTSGKYPFSSYLLLACRPKAPGLVREFRGTLQGRWRGAWDRELDYVLPAEAREAMWPAPDDRATAPVVSGAVAVLPLEPLSLEFVMVGGAEHAAYEQAVVDALAKDGRLKIVDRTELARVLQEYKLKLAGGVMQPAGAIIAADVLVLSSVVTVDSRSYLAVQAVHAATTSCLGQMKLPIDPARLEEFRASVAGKTARWWPGVLRNLAAALNRPVWTFLPPALPKQASLELTAANRALLRRLREVQASLEGKLAADRRLFYARPGTIPDAQREVLMGMLGMTRPLSSRFTPMADYLLQCDIVGKDTIHLRVLRGSDLQAVRETDLGPAAPAVAAGDWISAQLAGLADPPARRTGTPMPATHAAAAAQAMLELKQIPELRRQFEAFRNAAYERSRAPAAAANFSAADDQQELERRAEEINRHYRRAVQLDPTCEATAYAAAEAVADRRNARGYRGERRVAEAYARFLDTFPNSQHATRLTQEVSDAYFRMAYYLTAQGHGYGEGVPQGVEGEKVVKEAQRGGIVYLVRHLGLLFSATPKSKLSELVSEHGDGGAALETRVRSLQHDLNIYAAMDVSEAEFAEVAAEYSRTLDRFPEIVPPGDFQRLRYFFAKKKREAYSDLLSAMQRRWPDPDDVHWKLGRDRALAGLCELFETDPRGTSFYWWLHGKRGSGDLPRKGDDLKEDAKIAQPAASTAGERHTPAPPSVLFLPPRLPTRAGDAAFAAAAAACDRLAQDIAAAGLARVVDRTQFDRILQERKLQAAAARPMLAYDAMIRLEADTTRLAPQTMLGLIDLSTGNVIAQRAFAWPPGEAAAKPMLDFCRDALEHVAKAAVGKLRVRTLWSTEDIDNERIRPLGRRLIELFDESLRRSNRVLLVHHLEAATSKEESLLLLMGLSRLPGGRQFTPQADATIELRVVEGDGRGKTFPETPVEIGVRLRKGAAYQGDWVTTAGLVRDFDALIPRAWQKLARSLGEVRPETATTLLNEMALRRKQAEAELQTAKQLRKSQPLGANDGAKVLMAALPHVEAAIKLDPTCTEAARVYVEVLADLSNYDYEKRLMPEASLRSLRKAVRSMERFPQDSELCGALCSHALLGMRSPLNAFWRPQRYNDPLPPLTNDMRTLTPELVQALDAAKRLLERGVEDDVKFRFNNGEWMLVPVFRGMRVANVPAAERQAWLGSIGRRCLAKVKRGEARAIDPVYDWQECIHLQVRIAELLMEDGQMEAAGSVIARTQSEIPLVYSSAAHSNPVTNLMRALAGKAADSRLLAAFNEWIERGKKMEVGLIRLGDVFPEPTGGDHTPQPVVVKNPPMPDIEDHRHGNYRPLAEGDGRLYFYTNSPPWIAYIPLDAHSRPMGKAVRSAALFNFEVWDSIKEIPQPDWNEAHYVTAARYMDGKLYVGTRGSGLLAFDPKAETWKTYGPKQGLPSGEIDGFFPIGGHVLYCNTRYTHYMLNLADGTVTLVHRFDDQRGWEKDWPVSWNLRLAWRDGQRIVVIDDNGVLEIVQGKARQTTGLTRWANGLVAPGVRCAMDTDGRRFSWSDEGLYEIDVAGKAKRLFTMETAGVRLEGAGWQTTSLDWPLGNRLPTGVCATGSRVVFTDESQSTVYEVNTDTWYGPLFNLGLGSRPIATPSGMLWGERVGLTCLALDDVIAYAKSMGCVTTTAEYHRRKQQTMDAAKPLERAMLAIGVRQFDKAKAALRQVLDAEPDQPYALLLMGFLHVRDGLNQPDEAIKYFRRAAELQNNPCVSYSGMYLWVCVLVEDHRWKEAVDLCEKILKRYPGQDKGWRWQVENLRDESRQELGKQDAKRAAAGTSNKEERPAK